MAQQPSGGLGGLVLAGSPVTIGWILALIGLILAIVLAVVGKIDVEIAGLFGLAYLARLL